jgi:predicted nucleotidyltransferase
MRGSFVLRVDAFLRLKMARETVTQTVESGGREVDFVAHDLRKFVTLMLKHNGYVLEQLYSPLMRQGGAAFEELRTRTRLHRVRHLVHHYRGFARNQL